jgi:RimJ/RimL family protein N-acetyltransferase
VWSGTVRHELALDGPAFRLRPVTPADAEFICELRSDPLLSRFIHATSPQVTDQRRWLEQYFEREGDYYFIITRRLTARSEGTIGIYDVNPAARVAEWGRWIVRRGSVAAVESAWLVYRAAFELLQLDMVYSRTLAKNRNVVSFHDSCGIPRHAVRKAHVCQDGDEIDVVEHRMTREQWRTCERLLATKASALARRLESGD